MRGKEFIFGGIAIAIIVMFVVVINSTYSVDAGYTAIYQNKLSGQISVLRGPAFGLKMPMMASITPYKNVTTLTFSAIPEPHSSNGDDRIDVRFADTYAGKITMSARVNLPGDVKQLVALHESFRSYDNLTRSLFDKFLIDVVVNTAIQFTGEEFFQGSLNDFKAALEDQVKLGIIRTKRQKVAVDTGDNKTVPVGTDKATTSITKRKEWVFRAVPVKGKNGLDIRNKNPLTQYGVTVSQINLGNPDPEKRLGTLLLRKKELIAKKIDIIQRQDNARAEAKTAKLEGDTARVKAEQKMLMKADAIRINSEEKIKLAVLNMKREKVDKQKLIELEKLNAGREKVQEQKLADLAIIAKKKELAIATADKGIATQLALAAVQQAKAIEAKGLAEASVIAAKYNARPEKIYALEIQQKIVEAKYNAIRYTKIQMPHNVIIGSGKGSSSLSALTSTMVLDKLNNFELTPKTRK